MAGCVVGNGKYVKFLGACLPVHTTLVLSLSYCRKATIMLSEDIMLRKFDGLTNTVLEQCSVTVRPLRLNSSWTYGKST